MPYQEIQPSLLLDKYINCYWFYEDTHGGDTETAVPDGCVEIIFHLGERVIRTTNNCKSLNPRSNLIGQMTRPYKITSDGKVAMIGIRFFPHGAAPFFDFPIDVLQNEVIAINEIWKTKATFLEEAINEAQPDISKCIAIIERFLLRKLKSNPRNYQRSLLLQKASTIVLRQKGMTRIEELASNLNMSRRHLERLFKTDIGLSPKQFTRIVQFQWVFQLNHHRPDWSLTSLAYEGNYADQSHFSRTCKELTGLSPKVFFALDAPMHEHFRSEQNLAYLPTRII